MSGLRKEALFRRCMLENLGVLKDESVSHKRAVFFYFALMCAAATLAAAQQKNPPHTPAASAPTKADILRGAYGPYRANNDLLSYHLDIRVDPEKKFISGKNTIRFRMLKDGTRIQLDLHAALKIDKILLGDAELKYSAIPARCSSTFPRHSASGHVYTIDFYYSGNPVETGPLRRLSPSGRIRRAIPGSTPRAKAGASIWWPNKDQWRDEVEDMEISVAIPNGLMDVSNGKFVGKTDLGDGYTRWDWLVHYPINNYDVSLNIGNYEHFADQLRRPAARLLCAARRSGEGKQQFAQARGCSRPISTTSASIRLRRTATS